VLLVKVSEQANHLSLLCVDSLDISLDRYARKILQNIAQIEAGKEREREHGIPSLLTGTLLRTKFFRINIIAYGTKFYR
jgi:hypothetical protein